ncbi:MAG: hypothetical protein ACLVCH_10675 [Roseburia inulinivorans]
MFLRNKTARIICMAAFLVVFLPLAYITIPTVFILGKPAFMSMDAWVFMFGKQGGANQYILSSLVGSISGTAGHGNCEINL